MHRVARDPDASQTSHQVENAGPRPSARRLPSGAWGRLRAPPSDPLEIYGLPSKGETRLNEAKAQEAYYKKIIDRYMRFCASSGGADNLEQAFGSLHVSQKGTLLGLPQAENHTIAATPPTATTDAQKRELGTIVSAMRKLRESITATHRTDHFAQRAYVFIAHSTILTRHWESYQPALLYLLRTVHPHSPLPETEIREMAGYVVLDLACRQGDFGEAYRIKQRYDVRDRRIEQVLKALVHDDWVLFWRMRRGVDGYARALMAWAEDGMKVLALKCLGRAYLSADRAYIELCTHSTWKELVADGVGWELGDSGVVTIRRIKPK